MFVFGNYAGGERSEGHAKRLLVDIRIMLHGLLRKKKNTKRAGFYHIRRFIHFSDNKNETDKTDENFNRLWKMRAIFDKLNNS